MNQPLTVTHQPLPLLSQRNNPAMRTALAAVRGYMEAETVSQDATDRRMNIGTRPSIDALVTSTITVGQLPDDYGQAAAEITRDAAAYDAEVAALDRIRTAAADRCHTLVATELDTILAALHTQLETVIDNARHAIGNRDDDKLTAIHAEYRQIRVAQSVLMNTTRPDMWDRCRTKVCKDVHADDSRIANLDQIFPAMRSPLASESQRTMPPWPEDDGPELLRWFIREDAHLWVPTMRQLETLFNDRTARNARFRPDRAARAQRVR